MTQAKPTPGPWNPRYVAYAKAHGFENPQLVLDSDKAKHPGGCMAGFIIWISNQWQKWEIETKHSGPKTEQDHINFDRWLHEKTA